MSGLKRNPQEAVCTGSRSERHCHHTSRHQAFPLCHWSPCHFGFPPYLLAKEARASTVNSSNTSADESPRCAEKETSWLLLILLSWLTWEDPTPTPCLGFHGLRRPFPLPALEAFSVVDLDFQTTDSNCICNMCKDSLWGTSSGPSWGEPCWRLVNCKSCKNHHQWDKSTCD